MSNGYSYFTDPGQEFLLEQVAEQAAREQASFTRLGNDPQFMNNLAQYSTTFPTGSAELGLALTQGGVPGGDPSIQQYIDAELATRDTLGPTDKAGGGIWDSVTGVWDEWVDNPTKGSVRWGFAAWDAAYNMLAGGAPIRARQVADQQNIGYGEAWKQQDPYFFEALGGVLAGEEVNLGSGWMPNSDVAPDVRQNVNKGMEDLERSTRDLPANERYTKRLEGSPGVWTDAVSQSVEQTALGKPLTEMNYAETSSVMFDIDSWAGNRTRTPWSPGRIFAANLVEPGTEPFNKISATGDFLSQLFLDPVDWVGGGLAKAGIGGRRVWALSKKVATEVEEAAKVIPPTQLALPAGAPLPSPGGILDETRAIAAGLGPKSIVSGTDVPIPPAQGRTPWWLSPSEAAKRAVSRFDPPEWFIDAQRARRGTASLPEGGPSFKRTVPGVYEMDLPRAPGQSQQKLRILRKGKGKDQYWEVLQPDGSRVGALPDDPRFSTPETKFKTLKEAQAASSDYVTRYVDEDMRIKGMTAQEFIDSGEDFFVDDYQRVAFGGGNKADPNPPPIAHRVSSSQPDVASGPNGQNAKVRVFGKTYDLSSGVLPPDAPETLRAALRGDSKLRGGNLQGFGDQNVEAWDRTIRWMSENGYGKIKWDDDVVIVNNEFIGGPNSFDPNARIFYPDPDQPMYKYDYGIDTIDGPTPNDVQSVYDFAATSGGRSVRTDESVVSFEGSPMSKYEYDKEIEFMEEEIRSLEARGEGKLPHYGSRSEKDLFDLDETGFNTPKMLDVDEQLDIYRKRLEDIKKARESGEVISGPGSTGVPRAESGSPIDGIGAKEWAKIPDDEFIEVYHATTTEAATEMVESGITGKSKDMKVGDEVGFVQGQTGEGLYVGSNKSVADSYASKYNLLPGEADDYVVLKVRVRKKDVLSPREGRRGTSPLDAMNDPTVGGIVLGDIPPDNITAISRTNDMPLPARTQRAVTPASTAEGVGKVGGEGFEMPSQYGGVPTDGAGVYDEAAQKMAARIKQVDLEQAPPQARRGNTRPDFDADYELRGKKVDMLIDRLTATTKRSLGENASIRHMDKLLSFLYRDGITMPNSVRKRLFEAESPEALKSILAEWLVKEGGQEFILPGGMQYGKAASMGINTPEFVRDAQRTSARKTGVVSDSGRAVTRRFSKSISGRDVNMVEDPSAAYKLFDDTLRHYNLKRGDTVKSLDANGNEVELSVDAVFDRLLNLEQGDKAEAFEIMGDFSNLTFAKLTDDGVDPMLANVSTRWWKDNGEMALFEADRMGRVDLGSSPYDMINVKDELIGGLGPQITADLWTGQIKPVDARTMKRISNETDLLGRISNRAAWRWTDDVDDGFKINERAVIRAADAVMSKVWKPFVLLRGAWTLRILMDDQFRLAAEGYGILNNPLRIINYALTRPDDWRSAFKAGTVDVFGTPMNIKNIDEMMNGSLFRESLMSSSSPNFGPGAFGNTQHVRVAKGAKGYNEGLTFELQRFRGSPLVKRLASSKSEDPVDEVVRWLINDETAEVELRNQAAIHRNMGDVPEKILAKDVETLTNVVNRQYGMLHEKLGGDVVLDNGNGQLFTWRDPGGGSVGDSTYRGKPKWVVREEADKDLLSIVRGSKTIDGKYIGDLSTEVSMKEAQKLVARKVKANDSRFPKGVRRPKEEAVSRKGETLGQQADKAVRTMFDWLMTKPSDQFSRVPEFNRAYWDKISDLYPYMDDALRKQIDELSGTNPRAQEALARARKDKRGTEIQGQLTSMEQADLHAKAYGLTMVEKTLFTLTEKRNISDSLRIVFPFVEAWGEFIGRWGRLMVTGDRNVKNLNRLRQSVGGARRSGFFEENEYGQETFNYPSFMTKAQVGVNNMLNNLPGGEAIFGGDVSQEVAGNIQAQGNVESLNFASGILPGFGPIMQFVARALPQNPDFDWVRDLVAPFGTEGNVGVSFAPAWLKRVISAQGGNDDPILTYTYNSTVMDIIRTKIDAGAFAGVTSVPEINALVREAEQEAKGLLMVRAAATWWNPASPSYKFQKEDSDGLIWSYNNLGGEYYKMLEEADGDEATAFDMFYERFGSLPQAFTGGKTYSVQDRSRSESGSRFERSRPSLFEDYPTIAMYLDPNIGIESPYEHSATIRQLDVGLRESWTGEQFIYIQQDQLGDIWMENIKSKAELIPDTATKNAFLTSMRDQVQEAYPFWNKPVPGKRQSATNEQQRDELMTALEDGSLAGTPVLQAVRVYESYREEVLEQIRRTGASTIDGPKSTTSESGIIATKGREWLRKKADDLTVEFPEFGPLFKSIYGSEVGTFRDAPKPPVIDAYGEGDIFEEYGLAETDG